MSTLLLLGLLGSTVPAAEAETLSGQVVTGRLVEIRSTPTRAGFAGRIVLETDDGPVSWNIQQLLRFSQSNTRHPSGDQPGAWIELADGSSLLGLDYTVQEGAARITLLGGEIIELPSDDVTAVRLQPLAEAAAAEWTRLVESATDGDLLVVGQEGSINYHRGVLLDVTHAVVHFQLDGEVLPIKRSNVCGLVYYQPPGRELGESACRVIDVDGSEWAARSIELVDGDLHWTTPLGLNVARSKDEVTQVDFSQGKVLYLSELEPESVDWIPYFGASDELEVRRQFFGPREDRALLSGPLRLDGRPYRKGLALHSRTKLVYRLPGRFRRFTALVGIDDRVRPRGDAVLRIHGDDRLLLETTVKGTDPPSPLDLDLTGVRRLIILVDFGADLDVADHVDLCEARIVK